MKRWKVRLCLLVILVALPLGAFSPVKMSVAAETVAPTYGAPTYLDGSPVGGGSGYLNTVDESQADYVVDTAAELKSALAAAKSGEIVYVADGATITITSSNWYGNNSSDVDCGCYLKAGVTLAGGRGRDGVTGGIIKVSTSLQPTTFSVLIWCAGSGCRVTGLTLVGAQDGTTGGNLWCGIWTGDKTNVDNNEIHGFGCSGVRVDRDVNDVWIHHNYIHHNQGSGTGYGVYVSAYSIYHTASAIVEGNHFDYSRHHIAASHGRSSYVFRYNYLGANCTNTQIDCHGNNDGGDDDLDKDDGEYIYPAGENIEVYNNTSLNTAQPLVVIRGTPYSEGFVSVHNNWSYLSSKYVWSYENDDGTRTYLGPIAQRMDAIPGYGYSASNNASYSDGPFVRMESYGSWWGTTSPPSTNSAPATPAAPSGPASGETGTSYTYKVVTTDPDGDTITYTVDWGDGTSHKTSSKSSGTAAYPTHSWANAGTYAVKVKATDSKGNVSAWSPSLTVTITSASAANQPPLTPAAPSGPVSGKVGTSYTYRVKTTDPDGDTIAYTIDWGDGTSHTTSNKTSGTTAYPGHIWANAGTYAVKAKATDSAGNVSAWSPSLTVTISGGFDTSAVSNNPPMVPVSPSGATSALASFVYAYSAVTTDPDGDALSYTFDFGDGTVDTAEQVDSGATAYVWHVWAQPGTYHVTVSAADSEGNVSGWSEAIAVTVLESAAEDSPETGDSDSSGEATGPAQQGDSGADTPGAEVEDPDDGAAPSPPDHEANHEDVSSVWRQGPGLVLWLLTLIVMVGAAAVITGAIVRECVPKPPGWHGDLGGKQDP